MFDLLVVQIIFHISELPLLNIILLIILQTFPLILRSQISILNHFLNLCDLIILVQHQILQLLDQLLLTEVLFLELLQEVIVLNRAFVFSSYRVDIRAGVNFNGGTRTLIFIQLFNMVVKENGIVGVLFLILLLNRAS